jgi:hypothetical protein
MKLLKITSLSALLLFSTLIWNGCDPAIDPNDDGPDCTLPNADLSYTKNIKGIIDAYCISCHGGSGPGPDDYRSYEGMKSHLDEGHFLEQVVINKTMPQGGGMGQPQRDSINCWIKSGYPK